MWVKCYGSIPVFQTGREGSTPSTRTPVFVWLKGKALTEQEATSLWDRQKSIHLLPVRIFGNTSDSGSEK